MEKKKATKKAQRKHGMVKSSRNAAMAVVRVDINKNFQNDQ